MTQQAGALEIYLRFCEQMRGMFDLPLRAIRTPAAKGLFNVFVIDSNGEKVAAIFGAPGLDKFKRATCLCDAINAYKGE